MQTTLDQKERDITKMKTNISQSDAEIVKS